MCYFFIKLDSTKFFRVININGCIFQLIHHQHVRKNTLCCSDKFANFVINFSIFDEKKYIKTVGAKTNTNPFLSPAYKAVPDNFPQ